MSDNETARQFKVLMQGLSREQKDECPPAIPWAMIEPHEAQAKRNHSQTLQRLNERGGCAPNEIYAIMHDMDWSSQLPVDPIEWLKSLLAAAPTPASTDAATVTDAAETSDQYVEKLRRMYFRQLAFKAVHTPVVFTVEEAQGHILKCLKEIDRLMDLRDADARAIVDFARHCERGSLLDTHATAIEAAMERVKK